MSALTALLAFIIVYMPYQAHFAVVLPVAGLNLTNMLFAAALIGLLTRPQRVATPAPLRWQFHFFIAALVIAFFVGIASDDSRIGDDITTLKTHIFSPLFYFLFYYAIDDAKSVRILFIAILAATFLVSLHCIRQGLDYGLATFDWFRRASGPFARNWTGANFAAAFFIIFLPLYAAVWLNWKSRPLLRLAALPAAAFGVLGVMFTFSRQAMIVVPVLFLAHAMRRNLVVAALIIVVLLNYELWAPAGLVDRIQMTTGQAEQGVVVEAPKGGKEGAEDAQHLDPSTASRFLLWNAAFQMFLDRPWGVGLGHFGRTLPGYLTIGQSDPHNVFMRVLSETGVLGITALFLLLFGLFRLGGKLQKVDSSEDARVLGSGFTIAVLGIVAANLFGSRLFDGEVSGNFWVLAALVARLYTLKLEERARAATATSVPQAGAVPA
jgi:O-antigen ligase